MLQPLQRISIVAYTLIIVAILILAMVFGKSLLAPIAIAALLAMLLTPVMEKLMSWNIPRVLAAIMSLMLVVLFMAGVFSLVSVQAYSFVDNYEELKNSANSRVEELMGFVQSNSNYSRAELETAANDGVNEMLTTVKNKAGGIFSATTQGMTNFFLSFIYTLLFLLYHKRIKRAFIKFASKDNQDEAAKTLDKISKVAPQYLFGKLMLITFLAICYSIGLSIIGVKYGVLLGIIAAFLSIIPYIGNLIGGLMPMAMVLITSKEMWPIFAIMGLFAFAQFIESYFLEPLIVGGKVSINPMASIVGVVVAGGIWGIPGMIIAIPYMGIVKILCDQVDRLEPVSILIGDSKDDGWIEQKSNKLVEWIKAKFKK